MNTEPVPVSLDQLAGLPSMATLVLTVNNRHARRIVADLSSRLDAQRQVMALPDIVPLSAWLQQASDQLSFVADSGLAVHEYTALQIKKSVVGTGRAAKEQVQEMVRRLLALDGLPAPDSADALACAICHAHVGPLVDRLAALKQPLAPRRGGMRLRGGRLSG